MKPKLFVDGRAFDKHFEGTRTYIENLYKIISDIGDFEILIGSESDIPQVIFENSKNIKFIKYKKKQSKLQRAFLEIPEIISKNKIQASHFQYVTPPIKNSIQIVTIHDILFKDFPEQFDFNYRLIKGFTFYLSAMRANLVTTVSQYSKDALIRHFNLKPEDIHIIPNGVASSYFDAYDKIEAKANIMRKYGIDNFILNVSRIEPRKNQLDLLNAFIDLKLYNKNINLVFIGKKDIEVPELDKVMNTLPDHISKNIFFLNNINNDDLKTFYQSSRIFVYPSLAEGFGIPPLEAAAFSIPTICSNKTAMADFKFFGTNHIAPDINTIKEALLNNLENQDEHQLEKTKKNIFKNYNWLSASTKLNKLIWEQLNQK
jgi:glycosyltransferase involved in cell wall biosynthesis